MKVQSNPMDYNGHLDLIRFLRVHNLHSILETARERFNSFFPLSEGTFHSQTSHIPDLWRDWLDDESDPLKWSYLWKRAVAEYACENYSPFLMSEAVSLWLHIIQGAKRHKLDTDAVRRTS